MTTHDTPPQPSTSPSEPVASPSSVAASRHADARRRRRSSSIPSTQHATWRRRDPSVDNLSSQSRITHHPSRPPHHDDTPASRPTDDLRPPFRILWVFAWLVVGGEETEVRLLARNLPPYYHITVLPCFRKPNMPRQTHDQLRALGVEVDETAYTLSFEDTVDYIAHRLQRDRFDVVVASQGVPDIYPALEKVPHPPPLIEHGGLVAEVAMTPKHLTARYVGVCRAIRAAAAAVLPNPAHALEIPSMIDLAEFDARDRPTVRAEWGVAPQDIVIGWIGRLDPKKRVEDFIAAAADVARTHPRARFVVIGGPDAFFPEYADELQARAHGLGLAGRLRFLGDRPDIPRLLSGLDIFTWLSAGEGMPHVVSEAGAAGLPAIVTPDVGVVQQVEHEVTGLYVPHQSPAAVADALRRLINDPTLRHRLGVALRAHVERHYSATVVVPQWLSLFHSLLPRPLPHLTAAQSAPRPLSACDFESPCPIE